MSSLLTKPLVQHHLSCVSPIQLRDFPLHITRRGERRSRWDLSTSTPLGHTQLLLGVAVRRDTRRQRFASTAAVRRGREERGRHSFCREKLRGRHGGSTRIIPH